MAELENRREKERWEMGKDYEALVLRHWRVVLTKEGLTICPFSDDLRPIEELRGGYGVIGVSDEVKKNLEKIISTCVSDAKEKN